MDKFKLDTCVNFSEDWSRWDPVITGIEDNYYIESIQELNGDLKIRLTKINEDKHMEIFFEGLVCAYRSTYETFRACLINNLAQKYGSDFYEGRSLFKVANSRYAKWAVEESSGTLSENEITHFVIMGTESIVDVLAFEAPSVRISE